MQALWAHMYNCVYGNRYIHVRDVKKILWLVYITALQCCGR